MYSTWMLIKNASRGYFPVDTYDWSIKMYRLMVWRYIPVKKLDEKTNYITNLIAVNAVLIFLEFVYSCEWYTGLIKGAVVT